MFTTRFAAVTLGICLALGFGCAVGDPSTRSAASFPARDALPQFTAADVPATGADELPVDPPRWTVSGDEGLPPLPGQGLAQHPMLYLGEGCNTLFLINEGKVVWTYSTGKGWEYDDAWLLSNGNILFSRMSWAAEVTPSKKVVWRLDAPAGTEIHTVQPIGLDKVLLVENGTPPKAMIINTTTHAVELEHELPYLKDKGVHGQVRRIRMTAQGTFLVPFLMMDRVVEYDRSFTEIWSYVITSPWAAIRLRNGNTLITDEKDRLTREVTPQGVTAWEFRLADLPAELRLPDCQTCVRLGNGNTVFCSRGANGKGLQLVEVTRDKSVVWALKDWKDLGPATAVQILDDAGVPEVPGDLQR
jgi:hypothetical protein